MSKIFITGMGSISSIGDTVNEAFQNLKNMQHGVAPIQYLNTAHKDEFVLAEVLHSNEDLAEMLNINLTDRTYTRTALLAIIAAKEAFEDAQIDLKDGFRTGIISANTGGGMDTTERYYKTEKHEQIVDFAITHSCGDSTEKIAQYLGINGYLSTISTACSSSANAIMKGARLIKNGRLDRVIVGGVDSMSKFTLNGFNTLMILDHQHCQPWDENRRGLNLGEGAAYLVLESESIAKNKKIYGELKGYANANDAYHQTASSPEGFGATLAMKQALQSANLKPEDISYINVHGTGTSNNDQSEGAAMRNVFKNVPPFSSTKAYTGHTLGAAGAIEAVISLLSINHNIIFPALNIEHPIDEFDFKPIQTVVKNIEINNVLSNSFGFGGNNTTLIFSKY
ncbi:MAG: beta-ketoacyl-[acyl-carrier-protein] synthase family protein [Bacteroidales bacterium]|nr:beta-ketoacyl-[acyl-carrier-protein] synthase family protein [Bacteroidales bacterium]